MIVPRPSYCGYLARNCVTPVSFLGSRPQMGKFKSRPPSAMILPLGRTLGSSFPSNAYIALPRSSPSILYLSLYTAGAFGCSRGERLTLALRGVLACSCVTPISLCLSFSLAFSWRCAGVALALLPPLLSFFVRTYGCERRRQ